MSRMMTNLGHVEAWKRWIAMLGCPTVSRLRRLLTNR